MLLVSFNTPLPNPQTKSIRKPSGFLIFSGGIEKDQWHKMGQTPLVLIPNLYKSISVLSQPEITCSKLTIKTPKEGVKYVQS